MMVTPEKAENIVQMSKTTSFGAQANVRLLIETIEGLAEELSDMMWRYDSARDSLNDCGSEDHDADNSDKETVLENEVAQAWVKRSRRLNTTYRIRIKQDGEVKQAINLSYAAAAELVRELTVYLELCTGGTLDIEPMPEGDA